MSLRLDHATVVDPAPEGLRVQHGVSVHVEDGRITEVGSTTVEADDVLDATGCAVMPGLVNAHGHVAMTLLRGWADELPLERWLRERVWPVEAQLTASDVRAGAELGIAEMLAGGVSAFADMYFFEDAIAEAARDAGLRCLAGFSLIDHDTPEHAADALPAAAEAFLKRWPADGALVRGSIAPHAAYTCGPETLGRAAELSEHFGARLQTHCAETRDEVYTVETDTGRRPLAQLAEHGCVTERTLLAHCGWTTKDEVRRIAREGATVVHNPVANMKLATGGTTPVPELLAAGAPVALGTDGPASNNTLDVFETMKFTSLVHKQHRWQADATPAAAVLAMATRVGAHALGFEASGRVAEGFAADLAVVDLRRPHVQPLHDVVSQLVYAARASDVRTTIVGGNILYHEGEHRTMDAEAVVERASAAARRLIRTGDE